MTRVLTDVLSSLESVVLLAGHNTEGVRTKVVALSLQEVGRDDLTTVAVEEGKSSAEGRSRDSPEDGLGDNATPAWLGGVDSLVEEVVEEKRLEALVLLERSGNITKEDTLDDAAATPHRRNAGVIQIPAELKN